MTTMLARIVTSTRDPARLSIRAHDGVGMGGTFQHKLKDAGFKDGDVVELRVIKRTEAGLTYAWASPS
jgi:hypothetical protein